MNKNALITLVIIIVLAVGGWFLFGGKSFTTSGGGVGIGEIKLTSDYQAVFLSNGQVYFGMVKNLNNDTVEISDIYYLRVQQQIQPVQEGETADEQDQQPTQQIQLVKLGDELHGPKDKMYVNRRHILFVEDLKDDGQVVAAIQEHKKQKQNDSSDNSSEPAAAPPATSPAA